MALAHRVDDRPGLLRDVVRAGYGAAKTALDSVRHRGPVVTRWSPKDQRWHYRWPEGRAVDTGRWRDAQGWATRGFYYGMADLLWRRYRPRPGDVVLDIGAGNGGETLYLASLVGPTGRVLAIEAARLMETRKINALLVVDAQRRVGGALNVHDLLRARVV